LAQAHKVRIEFHKGFASETYMRMDGEPWMQPLPADDDSVTTVEITSLGQAAMLTTKKCIAQCVPDDTGGKVDLNGLTTPSRIDEMQATGGDDIEIQSVLSSSAGDNSEVRRKFGAAETFKRLTVQEQDVGFL
ncbi:hypothetical protein GOP47_0031128, partial [Adiantum capillus-veneris]